ncbi:MAG: HpcH/HpaI aldolase [Sphingomonas sp.]|uniref:HpcH/HpaI aldolase family protein n=1 Tax=Sphingomonas sp. TaxID=28214 RepID=UPI0026320B88|nr:aldolase/citrate lyase family protein [Sphingomonas sp.]MDK2766096.1 HpcH/HpaI aldolase [Sphingomonas sp.]
MSINESYIVEILLAEAFDGAIVDMQHGAVDATVAIRAIGSAAGSGKPVLVRIPIGDFACAAKLLDWGASAIIAPMINCAADAQLLVSFCRYPPVGARSWGPQRALAHGAASPGDYLRQANDGPLLIAMIETSEAMDHADAILDVDGIDGVFIGPADLSLSLTNGREINPVSNQILDSVESLATKARARGKHLLAFCGDGATAAAFAHAGCDLISISTDAAMIRLAARQELATARRTPS